MDRRTTLGTLAAGAAAALFAVRPAAAQMLGSPDALRLQALSGGTFAMQTSELALRSATMPGVRQFAQFEVEEQQAVLQAMRISGIEVPATVPMEASKLQMIEGLRAASGAEFDRMYVMGQVAGHEELQRVYATIANGGATAGERAIATLAVPSIRTHLGILAGLQQQMRG